MDEEKDWKKAILTEGTTLQQAITNLNETGFQIVLVTAPDNTFVGTITDGDIRRGLLRGLQLDSLIKDVINKTALIVPPYMERELVLHLLMTNKIHQAPIVDVDGYVVGLHLVDDLLKPVTRPNIMVIMAGGMGTRLLPHTELCPKPLLSVSGKPMIEHILERAKADGFDRFIFAIYHLGHMIEDYFGSGEFWNVDINYLKEESPLGTAGALALISPTPQEAFLVSNGDILTDIRYGELLDYHKRHNAAATMAVRQYEWQNPFGVVQTKGLDIVGVEEKPVTRTYVNAGIYVLEPFVLEYIRESEHCDMPLLFQRIRQNGFRTIVYPIHEPWLDVGEPVSFALANHIA